MVGLYQISNKMNGNTYQMNELSLLKVIKALDGRNKPLQEHYITIWENLEGKKFNKSYLELV